MPSSQGVDEWWLILCVNLGYRVPTYLVRHCSGVAVRVFWDEINIWIGKPSKAIALPNMSGPHSISWRHEQTEQKVDPPPREGELLQQNNWAGTFFFLMLLDPNWNTGSSWVLSLPAFRLELKPWVLLLVNCRSWDLAFIIMWANFL